jgi:catechol 2,3-dioxygenase-like lactoylglutathione lyase family enzyme
MRGINLQKLNTNINFQKKNMISIKDTNVTIMVKDMDKAISFYESIGLTLKQRWDNHYAMMTAPGITIGLHPSEKTDTNSGSVSIGFMIDTIDEAKTLLDSNKIECTPEDDGKSGIYLHFKDPFGTILYFVQPKWY